MREKLVEIILNFIVKYRSCPFEKFLWFLCRSKQELVVSKKRKRESLKTINPTKKSESNLKDFISPKKVYCFIRRCLIYILDVDIKKPDNKKYNDSCLILGGNFNFFCLIRKVNFVISGLKYDTLALNHFLHGIKFARM